MRIVTYRDLKSKDGLMPLMDHAFRWVFNQTEFEHSIKTDPRLKEGPVGFCALEDSLIIGQVGVMDIPTRTANGDIECVGGIYGAATLPGYTSQGVCTTLMNIAHDYFIEKGHDFSFLVTSQSLIAHSLYRRLGYSDLIEYPSAYKNIENKRQKTHAEKSPKLDFDKILKMYNIFTEDKTGFVVRDKAFMKAVAKGEQINPKQCIANKNGYMIFRDDKSGIDIREIIALNGREMDRLVDSAE
jgi:predicted acetyltransferase